MVVLVIASQRDIAAQNIAKEIIRTRNFLPVPGTSNLFQQSDVFLKLVDSDGIFTDKVELPERIDSVVFASRHRSESGELTLTVHWTGNPTSHADFGGKPKSLSFTEPTRLRSALLAFDRARSYQSLNYTVSLEATHHGPTELGVPTLFVEIGSSEQEWNDPLAVSAASEAVWNAATAPVHGIPAVGFGGGHYCNKQGTSLRSGGYAFSHILSKYFFDEYDEEIVSMAFERTLGEKCHTAIIDWKGIRGPERRKLVETLTRKNIDIIRV
ncbi:MAG: D-aminoacyl-tRNA deacylase [Candidatus Bathyarchaeia archaeon]|jgi:D-aminoacyl-tRNA deacylase